MTASTAVGENGEAEFGSERFARRVCLSVLNSEGFGISRLQHRQLFATNHVSPALCSLTRNRCPSVIAFSITTVQSKAPMLFARDTEQSILNALDLATNKKERTVESKRLINIRILGHLLARGPSDAAIAHITSSIISCEPDAQKLDLLGDFYDKHFIRTCNSLSPKSCVIVRC